MRRASRELAMPGNPAVRYGTSAVRRAWRSCRHASLNRDSDKEVANDQAMPFGGRHLDDGAGKLAIGIGNREIDEVAGWWNAPAVRLDGDSHDRPVQLFRVGTRTGHDRHLERIENDTGP